MRMHFFPILDGEDSDSLRPPEYIRISSMFYDNFIKLSLLISMIQKTRRKREKKTSLNFPRLDSKDLSRILRVLVQEVGCVCEVDLTSYVDRTSPRRLGSARSIAFTWG